MSHFKHNGIKYTNTTEARNYVSQSIAMQKFHRINRVKAFFVKLAKRLIVISLIISALYAFYGYAVSNSSSMIKIQVEEKKVLIDNLTPKINTLKDEVLDTLRNCESQGATEDTGLIVFDSNKVASIGLYQFQKATVQAYYKALYNKDITGKEAIEIALDSKQARALASDIIFSTTLKKDKGINNWYNCNKKHNLQAKVDFINKLTENN